MTRPKPLLLLAYLALEGPQARRHLAELFWPGAAQPMNSLRVALAQVRASAPGALGEAGARLEAGVGVDALDLLGWLEVGAREEAVRAYAGPFLDGVYLPDMSAELEEWVYATREYLARRVRGALLALAERDAAGSDFKRAAARAERAVALGASGMELAELTRLHALLVAGDSSQADTVRREAAELGLSLAVTRRDAQVQFAGGVATVPHTLPLPMTSFVGRDPELLELSRLLGDPDTRLITLIGAGGVGKTRLALQAARQELRSGRFPDGVFFVALESLSTSDLIVSALARDLGVMLSGQCEPLAELAGALCNKALLLVLDNCEHLPGAAAVAQRLLGCSPTIKALATSRTPLGLAGEQHFPLGGLPVPAVGSAHDSHLESAQEALRLFWQRARRVQPDFALTPDTLPAALDICRLVDGSPLGIELAAAWMRTLSPREVAGELARDLDFLAAPGSAPGHHQGRHQSLRATFEHSWRLLSDREQGVLRRLSVFAGGFTRAAAAEVAAASPAQLASLIEKSLLRLQDEGRYDRHPLVYGYTREKLSEHPAEEQAAQAAHAGVFLRLAEAAEAAHRGPEQALWLGRLELEQDNLRAALAWTLAGGDLEAGLKLAVALYHFWYYRSHLLEGETWLQRALAVAVTEPAWTPYRSRLLSAAGVLASERGDDTGALRLFEERLALARSQNDLAGQAAALNSMGIIAWNQQEHARARTLIEASMGLRRRLKQPKLLLIALNNLGLVELAQGNLEAARGYLEESLAISRDLGDEMGLAMSLSNLGAVAVDEQDPAEAERRLVEALPHYQAVGDRDGLGHCLEGFAAVAALRAQPRLAARLAGAAERLRESVGAPLSPADRARHERRLAPARAALSAAAWAAAHAEGRTWSAEEAAAQALATVPGTRRNPS